MTARHGGYVESYEIIKYDDNLFLVILLTPVLNVPNAKIKSQFFLSILSALYSVIVSLSLSLIRNFILSLLVVKYNGSVSWVFNGVFGGGFSSFLWWIWWSVARWWVQWFWVDFCMVVLILWLIFGVVLI